MDKVEWEKLTPGERRVIIAKDVITQVNTGKYYPTKGTYYDETEFESTFYALENEEGDPVELQNVLKKIEQCDVCAKGALLMSDILQKNKCKMTFYEFQFKDNSDFIDDRLSHDWSIEQLDLIETAFESSTVMIRSRNDNNRDLFQRAEEFRAENRFDNSKDLLIGIMQNIIDNNGTFIP